MFEVHISALCLVTGLLRLWGVGLHKTSQQKPTIHWHTPHKHHMYHHTSHITLSLFSCLIPCALLSESLVLSDTISMLAVNKICQMRLSKTAREGRVHFHSHLWTEKVASAAKSRCIYLTQSYIWSKADTNNSNMVECLHIFSIFVFSLTIEMR